MTDVQLGGLEALEREKLVSHDGSSGDRTRTLSHGSRTHRPLDHRRYKLESDIMEA